MRHLYLLLCTLTTLLASSFSAKAADGEHLILSHDGNITVYMLDEKPNITFSNDSLKINGTNLLDQFSLDLVDYIAYEGVESSINEVIYGDKSEIFNEIPFSRSGSNLIFPGRQSIRNISIFSIDGRQVYSNTLKSGEAGSINLSRFLSGIGILTVNGITYKIAVK